MCRDDCPHCLPCPNKSRIPNWRSYRELRALPEDCVYNWKKPMAVVTLARARSLCIIMGPLDMKGLVAAATVISFLMYGAGHVFIGRANFHLHDTPQGSPSDSEFAWKLVNNCGFRSPDFPPPAIAEALEDYVNNKFKVRRLHLIIVDTWRPWRYNVDQVRAVTAQMWHLYNFFLLVLRAS